MGRDAGWHKILLVTSPAHTRRAKLVFQKAGFEVAVTSSSLGFGDLAGPHSVETRCHMLREWWHEAIGTMVYRLLGRV
jgi:uncharacterized SAM-binding protein YcdF (DUF218 family)